MQQADRPEAAAVASYDSLDVRRTMLSKPLAYPSTLDRRPSVALSVTVVVLRGGALEPDAQ